MVPVREIIMKLAKGTGKSPSVKVQKEILSRFN